LLAVDGLILRGMGGLGRLGLLRGAVHLILSAGTRVVTRQAVNLIGGPVANGGRAEVAGGAVGTIVVSPADATHAYKVRFNDGAEAMIRRSEFSILKEFKAEGLEVAAYGMEFEDWQRFVIYRCVVGSQAFGLSGADSDVDRRGIFLSPASLEWSLFGVPEQVENEATQEVYWELQKFLTMALKANPNILECLYTPQVEVATDLARELLANRQLFLSKLIYQTYNGYVTSQFKKLEQDLRARGEIKWKHAMHLIRLLLSGVDALKTGDLRLDRAEHREELLKIKRGETAWSEVNAWRLELHREFDAAFATTKLPERPNYEWANEYLIRARRFALDL
jgi:predicted nucleotidyltransferase